MYWPRCGCGLLLARLAPGCARAAPSLLKIRSATSHSEATNRKPHRGKSRHRNPESPSFAPGPNDLRKHRGGSGVRTREPRDLVGGPVLAAPAVIAPPARVCRSPSGPEVPSASPPFPARPRGGPSFLLTTTSRVLTGLLWLLSDRVDPKRGGVRLGRPQLGAARDQSHHPRRRRCTGHAIDHHRVQSPGRTDRTHGAGGR